MTEPTNQPPTAVQVATMATLAAVALAVVIGLAYSWRVAGIVLAGLGLVLFTKATLFHVRQAKAAAADQDRVASNDERMVQTLGELAESVADFQGKVLKRVQAVEARLTELEEGR